MERTEFEKVIRKSSTKQIIIALFILAFGILMLWLVLSGADSEMDDIGTGGMIILWILIVLCISIGGLITWKALKAVGQVKSGNHPILKAIDTNDKGFIVWAYENITQVKGGGKDHYVYIFTREGKQINISTKGKRVQGILKFIKQEFPQAEIGYSEEFEKQYRANNKAMKNAG